MEEISTAAQLGATFVLASRWMGAGAGAGSASAPSWLAAVRPSPRSLMGFLTHVPLTVADCSLWLAHAWPAAMTAVLPAPVGFLLTWIVLFSALQLLLTHVFKETKKTKTRVAVGAAVAALYVVYLFRVFTTLDHVNHLVGMASIPGALATLTFCLGLVAAGVTLWMYSPAVADALLLAAGLLLLLGPPLLFGTTIDESVRAIWSESHLLPPGASRRHVVALGAGLCALGTGALRRSATSFSAAACAFAYLVYAHLRLRVEDA